MICRTSLAALGGHLAGTLRCGSVLGLSQENGFKSRCCQSPDFLYDIVQIMFLTLGFSPDTPEQKQLLCLISSRLGGLNGSVPQNYILILFFPKFRIKKETKVILMRIKKRKRGISRLGKVVLKLLMRKLIEGT